MNDDHSSRGSASARGPIEALRLSSSKPVRRTSSATLPAIAPQAPIAATIPTIPLLSVRFPPSWSYIEPLRMYVVVRAKDATDAVHADAAGIVLQELLENAVKYGDPSTEVELELHLISVAGPIEIRVTNSAHPSRIAVLERELQRTNSDSAHAAFASALARLHRLPAGTTMLGLARIATAASLSARVEGNRVAMIARII